MKKIGCFLAVLMSLFIVSGCTGSSDMNAGTEVDIGYELVDDDDRLSYRNIVSKCLDDYAGGYFYRVGGHDAEKVLADDYMHTATNDFYLAEQNMKDAVPSMKKPDYIPKDFEFSEAFFSHYKNDNRVDSVSEFPLEDGSLLEVSYYEAPRLIDEVVLKYQGKEEADFIFVSYSLRTKSQIDLDTLNERFFSKNQEHLILRSLYALENPVKFTNPWTGADEEPFMFMEVNIISKSISQKELTKILESV